MAEIKMKVEYEELISREILKPAGVTNKDVELSIQLARSLSNAVRIDCAKDTSLTPEERKAEHDRAYVGAALFLAQRMKPKGKKDL